MTGPKQEAVRKFLSVLGVKREEKPVEPVRRKTMHEKYQRVEVAPGVFSYTDREFLPKKQ